MTLTRISNAHLTVEIASLGAEMQSIVTADGKSWLWHGDAAFWGGRAPVLFPIVGKAPGDVLGIDGAQFPMGQHGFARRSEFVLEAAEGDYCRFVLHASAATRAVYPFEFALTLEYQLQGSGLKVTSTVTNLDTGVLSFQLGYHPAFAWPLPGGEGKDHRVVLDNGGAPRLARLAGGLLKSEREVSPFVGGALVLDHEMFVADAMIFTEGAGEGLVYGVEGGPSITFGFDELPNLALWSKPGAPFVCIEPWHGMAARVGSSNEMNQRPEVVDLPPGQAQAFGYFAVFRG